MPMKYGFAAEEMIALIDAHFAALVLFAQQWNAGEAEDLVQEAFVQLLKVSHKKGCPENVAAWLFQVVRNGAISRFRRNSRREKREKEHGETRIHWSEPTQNTDLESKELLDLLEHLPMEHREVVIMRIWGSLSFDEIAKAVGVSRTTVFRKYSESLQELKRRLEP